MAERRRIGGPDQNCLSTLGGLPIYTTLASKMQIWPPNIYNSTHIYPNKYNSTHFRNLQGNQTNSEIDFGVKNAQATWFYFFGALLWSVLQNKGRELFLDFDFINRLLAVSSKKRGLLLRNVRCITLSIVVGFVNIQSKSAASESWACFWGEACNFVWIKYQPQTFDVI